MTTTRAAGCRRLIARASCRHFWSALPVTVDGNVDASNEYADAERMVIRYRDGLRACDAIVSLVYREDTLSNDHALYVGITRIGDTIGGWARSNSLVALNIDPDYSRNATVQTSDFRVRGYGALPISFSWGTAEAAGEVHGPSDVSSRDAPESLCLL